MENNKLVEQKAFAFEVSNIVNDLTHSDARTIYLIAQALKMKNDELIELKQEKKLKGVNDMTVLNEMQNLINDLEAKKPS